jgi:DNA-binding MarR family transcriptional regulator
MARTRWMDTREAAAWRGLQLMQMRLEAALSRRLAAESSLSLQDYVVLVALTDQPDDRMRAFALAEFLGWDKTRLSHHLKRMAARGLVDKAACPTDGRGHFVVATDQGRREIAAAAPGHLAAVRSLFLDHVTREELDVIAAVTQRVLDRMQEEPTPSRARAGAAAHSET